MIFEFITKDDLEEFRIRLLSDIKDLIPQNDKFVFKEWIKGKEVRRLLDNSVGTLQNLRISGRLKYKKVGGTFYYKLSEIEEMLNSKQV